MTFGSPGRAWAVLALCAISVLLVSLPALVAVGLTPSRGAVLAWLAASLAVVSGGGKLAALVLGLGYGLVGSLGRGAGAASTE